MTKKHFVLFATQIREQFNRATADNRREIAMNQIHLVGIVAKQVNSNFDFEKFKKACGID